MWLARNKDGALYLYAIEPIKCEITWSSFSNASQWLELPKEEFLDVKWGDDRPTEVILKRVPKL